MEKVGHGVTGLVARILTAAALPPLLARLTGGHPPGRITQLAALAPAATVPATAAVIIAATTAPWLPVLLAIPAVILWIWQLPPRKRTRSLESRPATVRSAAATSTQLRSDRIKRGIAGGFRILRRRQWVCRCNW
jgi:hypothetical protein